MPRLHTPLTLRDLPPPGRSLALLAVATLGTPPLHAEAELASQGASDQVVIEGERAQQYLVVDPSMQKLTQSLVDTPQSITTVTQQELQDRALNGLADALRNVPGISLGAGETSWQGNNAFLRGFTTRNDTFTDAQRDYGYYFRDVFNTEQVEVLKGPSSLLFGRGSTGGVVNQVTKTPRLESFVAADVSGATSSSGRATLDVGAPIAAFGDGAAFRLNAMGDHTEVQDRDVIENRRWGIAPSLALGLGTPTRVTVTYMHQSDDGIPDYGIPWQVRSASTPATQAQTVYPTNVERSNFYGFTSDYLETDVNQLTARVEHDFGKSLLLTSQVRYAHNTRSLRNAEAVVRAGTLVSTPVAAVTVDRSEYQTFSTDEFLQNQTDLTARFATGGVAHALVTGFEVGREAPEPAYVANTGIPPTNLGNPTHTGYTTAATWTRLTASTTAKSLAIYALDTIELGSRWQVTGGIRWDRFDADYQSLGYPTATTTIPIRTDIAQVDKGFSYRGGVVFKPSAASSLYASFGTSFNPSAEGIESLVSAGRSVAQANIRLDPEESRNYELGGKWNLPRARVLLTGALFHLEKSNVRVPGAVTGFNVLGGDQRVNGAELEAMGQITSVWKLRAGYTYLDSETTRSSSSNGVTSAGAPIVGAPIPNAPRNTFTLFTSYQFSPAFDAGVGLLSMSSRYAQTTLAQFEQVRGYTTLEFMARYAFAPNLSAQLNVYNATDKYYIDALHPAHVIPGEGRMARLTLAMKY